MEDETWPVRPIFSRRRVLALGGAAAAAAILAACGSDSKNSAATNAPAGGTAAGATGTTAGTPATTAAAGGTAAANTTAAAGGSGNAAQFGGGGGDGTVKIGFTAPLTGPLAGFGEANAFILDGINKLAADGIKLGDKSYKVQIIQKDVGCVVCLAHRCTIGFECLKAVEVDEVFGKVKEMLGVKAKSVVSSQ